MLPSETLDALTLAKDRGPTLAPQTCRSELAAYVHGRIWIAGEAGGVLMTTAPAPAEGALAGVRVLDLTGGVAGPVAGMLLADLGADVVKVATPTSGHAVQHPASVMWDRNKCHVVLDPAVAEQLELLTTLVDRADVVLVGTTGGAVDFDVLLQRGLRPGRPGRWIVLPPYLLGETPWAGGRESGGLLFAWLGHAWSQGSYSDLPVDCLYPLALHMQGVWAATLAVALLIGGQGGRPTADLAVSGGAHGAVLLSPGGFAAGRDDPHIHRPGGPGGALPNYRCYRCADGQWLFFGAFTTAFIIRGFTALGLAGLLDDQRIGGDAARVRLPDNQAWLIQALEQQFARRTRTEWLAALGASDVPVAAVLASHDWLDHEQVRAMGLRAELTDDQGRTVVMPGILIGLSETPASLSPDALKRQTSPRSVLCRWNERPGRAAPASDRAPEPPLRGKRVLDLGTIIAGPFISTLLGELGADVVKVERPPFGDEFRVAHGGRGGVGFAAYNRDQRSVVLDLARPAGADAFTALVRSADVVVENYRPGVIQRLGIDHAALSKINALVTTVSVSAFGGVGPLGDRPGFDPVVQAMSGIMRSQGGPSEDDSPVFLTVPVNDVLAGALGALGACASLYARGRLHRGQHVSVTLSASACLAQAELLVRYEGCPPPLTGGRDFSGRGPLDRLYEAVDGWLRMDARWPEDRGAARLAGLVTDRDATSPEEATSAIARTVRQLPLSEVLRRCSEAGLPAVRARQPRELVDDAGLIEHGLLAVRDRDERGVSRVVAGRWLDIAGIAQAPPRDGPLAGEHSGEVLGEVGFSAEAVADLARAGVVLDATRRAAPHGKTAGTDERDRHGAEERHSDAHPADLRSDDA